MANNNNHTYTYMNMGCRLETLQYKYILRRIRVIDFIEIAIQFATDKRLARTININANLLQLDEIICVNSKNLFV